MAESRRSHLRHEWIQEKLVALGSNDDATVERALAFTKASENDLVTFLKGDAFSLDRDVRGRIQFHLLRDGAKSELVERLNSSRTAHVDVVGITIDANSDEAQRLEREAQEERDRIAREKADRADAVNAQQTESEAAAERYRLETAARRDALLAKEAAEMPEAEEVERVQREAQEEQDRTAQAERDAQVDRDLAQIERDAQAERARLARVEADAQAERDRLAQMEADAQAERDRLAQMEADAQAERARLAQVEADAQAERDRLAQMEADAQAERARLARVEADAQTERDRLAQEQADAEAERIAKAARDAQEERDRIQRAAEEPVEREERYRAVLEARGFQLRREDEVDEGADESPSFGPVFFERDSFRRRRRHAELETEAAAIDPEPEPEPVAAALEPVAVAAAPELSLADDHASSEYFMVDPENLGPILGELLFEIATEHNISPHGVATVFHDPSHWNRMSADHAAIVLAAASERTVVDTDGNEKKIDPAFIELRISQLRKFRTDRYIKAHHLDVDEPAHNGSTNGQSGNVTFERPFFDAHPELLERLADHLGEHPDLIVAALTNDYENCRWMPAINIYDELAAVLNPEQAAYRIQLWTASKRPSREDLTAVIARRLGRENFEIEAVVSHGDPELPDVVGTISQYSQLGLNPRYVTAEVAYWRHRSIDNGWIDTGLDDFAGIDLTEPDVLSPLVASLSFLEPAPVI